jgi:hypothetical protein
MEPGRRIQWMIIQTRDYWIVILEDTHYSKEG